MALYYSENTRMCDMISREPALLQVLTRFGIKLGVGDKTVAEVCQQHQVDIPTFLALVNFPNDQELVSSQFADRVSVPALVSYLEKAHSYFLDFQLPGIRRKLLEAIDCSKSDDVAYMILRFYDDYMGEVRRHMQHENRKIFTYVEALMQGKKQEGFSISQFAKSHISINNKLQELKNIIIKYYTPTGHYDRLNSVLFDIFNCESDLHTHCQVEDKLFVPAVMLLEDKVGMEEESDPEQSGEALSEREKEIVNCVVRGMTNKEIAGALFISVNTVITHRKNISRKLNIHSVSGLTIYAIVNSIVNLEDVRMQ